MARKVVEPLNEKLPTLASCNIRLGSVPDISLQNLAHRIATLEMEWTWSP